jgi:predicted PurR-regulated permease PerM
VQQPRRDERERADTTPFLTPPRQRVLRAIGRWALVIGALMLIGRILWLTGITLTPFILGLVLAYLLLPIVKRLDHWMPRWASITVVYLVGLVLLELALVFVVPPAANQVDQFVDAVPGWVEIGENWVDQQVAAFNQSAPQEVKDFVNEQVENIQNTVRENASAYATRVGEIALNTVVSVFDTVTFLLGFLVIPFFLFYVLLDTRKIPKAINTMLHDNIREDFWNMWHIIDNVFGRYIRGQILLGLVIATMSFIGLTLLNMFGFEVRYTVLLALIAGVGELIPVVGPILSAIPAIIVAFGGGTDAVIAVIVLYVLIQQLENQILVPRIVGDTLRLHPAILMALLVIAATIGGLLLVILSAPLTAIGRDVFIYLHRRLREPPQSPQLAIEGLLQSEEKPQPARRPRRPVLPRGGTGPSQG